MTVYFYCEIVLNCARQLTFILLFCHFLRVFVSTNRIPEFICNWCSEDVIKMCSERYAIWKVISWDLSLKESYLSGYIKVAPSKSFLSISLLETDSQKGCFFIMLNKKEEILVATIKWRICDKGFKNETFLKSSVETVKVVL